MLLLGLLQSQAATVRGADAVGTSGDLAPEGVLLLVVLLLVAAVIGFLAYFFPVFVAAVRGHHNTLAIFMLTVLLGWTMLGWVFALVWSCTAVRRPWPVRRYYAY